MNRLELLKEVYEDYRCNLFFYSTDATMEKPKEEYKQDWLEHLEKAHILEAMIREEEEKMEKADITDIMYIVEDSNRKRIERTVSLEEAVECAEKTKRKYMTSKENYDVEVNVFDEENYEVIYEAHGYENEEENEEDDEDELE